MKKKTLCGIYYWEVVGGNTNKIGWKYIGQSEDIVRRKKEHKTELKSGISSSPKLQKYYNKYGKNSLRFGILHECEIIELNFYEKFWIKCFDSYQNGLNCTEGGHNSVSDKLRKPCLFKNMITGEEYRAKSLIEFANKFGFDRNSVSALHSSHNNYFFDWYCPETNPWRPKWHEVIAPNNIKHRFLSHKTKEFAQAHNLPSSQLCKLINGTGQSCHGWKRVEESRIKHRRPQKIQFPIQFLDPTGKIYIVSNIKEFAKEIGINHSRFYELYYKIKKHHKGWRLYQPGEEIKPFSKIKCKLISKENKIYSVENLQSFARQFGLNASELSQIKLGKKKEHKGWSLYKD